MLCCAVLEFGTKVAARVRKQKTVRTTDRLKGASASWGLSFVRIMRLAAFLGAFLKFQKATLRFVMSVCLSVRMEQLGCHRTDFYEMLYMRIFRKPVEKIQVSFKSDKINGWYFA